MLCSRRIGLRIQKNVEKKTPNTLGEFRSWSAEAVQTESKLSPACESNLSFLLMNCPERCTSPLHPQIAIWIQQGMSHKVCAPWAFDKLIDAWVEANWCRAPANQTERHYSILNCGLSWTSHLCLYDRAVSSLLFIIHMSSGLPVWLFPICWGSISICLARPRKAYIWYVEREGEREGEAGGYKFISLCSLHLSFKR